MNKHIGTITLFLIIVMIASVAQAEINNYPPVKAGDCVTIKQVCASCSYVNASIFFPNSTLAATNIGMVDEGGGTWTYEFCNTTERGRYDVTGSGDLKGTDTGFEVLYFDATSTGKEFTEAKSRSYTIVLIISILLFLGILFIAIKLPSNNKSDELTGYIIAVSNLKYVRSFLFGLSYLMTVWISYFLWMMTHAFLDFTFLSSLFKIMFYTLALSTFPFFVLYVYFNIANFIRDKDIADLLLRGLTVRK